jgi:hypothetical protein
MKRAIGVAMFAAVVAGACGGNRDHRASSTTTSEASTVSTEAKASCSASNLSPTVPVDDTLPAVVATMRADMARAAVACDYDALRVLVDRNGTGVKFSFGAATDPIAAWRDAESSTDSGDVKPLRALRLLLGLHAGKMDLGQGHVQYAWPVAHTVERPTDAQLQEVADTGLYDMATLKRTTASGTGYLGYRVLITAEGDWSAFVAGD